MLPKISIIIPVYNVEKYIRECLDSVVNQTMKEIQIICVNDGSQDGSRSILQEYADKDSRIEIIDKENGGPSSARNAAISRVNGKYLLFLDSDDWLDKNCCEKIYQKAETSNAEITMFFFVREMGESREFMLFHESISAGDKVSVKEKITTLGYRYPWGKLYRTDFITGNRILFPLGLIFEDTFFSWKIITLAKRVSVVPEAIYHYRYHGESITHMANKYSFDIIKIFNLIQDFLRTSCQYHDYKQPFIEMKLIHFWSFYYKTPKKKRKEYFKLMQESLTEDDRDFYKENLKNVLPEKVRRFYLLTVEHQYLQAGIGLFFDLLRRFFRKVFSNRSRI